MGMRLLLGRSDTVVRRERLVRSDREDEGRRSEVLSPSRSLLASLRFVAISLAESCADYIPPRMDCAPQIDGGSAVGFIRCRARVDGGPAPAGVRLPRVSSGLLSWSRCATQRCSDPPRRDITGPAERVV